MEQRIITVELQIANLLTCDCSIIFYIIFFFLNGNLRDHRVSFMKPFTKKRTFSGTLVVFLKVILLTGMSGDCKL